MTAGANGGVWSGEAPGKLILVGEHAVLDGHRAVAGAVGLRTRVSLRARPGPSGLSDSGGYPRAYMARLSAAVATILPPEGLEVDIQSTLPACRGMGSSAALSVALVRALAAREGRSAPLEECLTRGFLPERVFHGTPSGVDHLVCAHGGLLLVRPTPSGPSWEALDGGALHVVVVDTGGGPDTADMVAAVRARSSSSMAAREALDRVGALAEDAVAQVRTGDRVGLGRTLDAAHAALQVVGASTARLDAACAVLRDAGCLGAKLSGAGGGGVALGLASDAATAGVVRDTVRSLGFPVYALVLGGEG